MSNDEKPARRSDVDEAKHQEEKSRNDQQHVEEKTANFIDGANNKELANESTIKKLLNGSGNVWSMAYITSSSTGSRTSV
ncbi:hypothetical protein TrLO_g9479 [Triparma laevis f. longispina]|uniref:Uncharacterized protein n=1 Tax=Triparma laevis f. longispina TaxID=1714387 RepID=A0A9W7AT19_9STRA|nr:hypothetical protein TrLO_g9479 [Triparma laevis f. longispina]